MGVEYSAGVFFGACVRKTCPLGKRLARHIDGGTPAATEIPGVEVSEVGSASTGDLWITVQAADSAHSFGRHEHPEEPRDLVEDPAWRPALSAFFESLRLDYEPPSVGWYFAGSVS